MEHHFPKCYSQILENVLPGISVPLNFLPKIFGKMVRICKLSNFRIFWGKFLGEISVLGEWKVPRKSVPA